MYSIYRLFKYTYFMLLRSLQNISQSYIKYTENTLFIHDNDDDNNIIAVIIIAVTDDNNDTLRIKKKLSFKQIRRLIICQKNLIMKL